MLAYWAGVQAYRSGGDVDLETSIEPLVELENALLALRGVVL